MIKWIFICVMITFITTNTFAKNEMLKDEDVESEIETEEPVNMCSWRSDSWILENTKFICKGLPASEENLSRISEEVSFITYKLARNEALDRKEVRKLKRHKECIVTFKDTKNTYQHVLKILSKAIPECNYYTNAEYISFLKKELTVACFLSAYLHHSYSINKTSFPGVNIDKYGKCQQDTFYLNNLYFAHTEAADRWNAVRQKAIVNIAKAWACQYSSAAADIMDTLDYAMCLLQYRVDREKGLQPIYKCTKYYRESFCLQHGGLKGFQCYDGTPIPHDLPDDLPTNTKLYATAKSATWPDVMPICGWRSCNSNKDCGVLCSCIIRERYSLTGDEPEKYGICMPKTMLNEKRGMR